MHPSTHAQEVPPFVRNQFCTYLFSDHITQPASKPGNVGGAGQNAVEEGEDEEVLEEEDKEKEEERQEGAEDDSQDAQ